MTERKIAIPIEESSDTKLDPTEERILKDQISFTERKESYTTLYRFATKLDWIIIIARQIREQYFRAILRQNIAYFDKYGLGEVTTRITSDVHLIQDGISEKVALAFQAGIIAEETISTIRTAVAFGTQKALSNLYDTYLADARKEAFKKSLFNGFAIGIMYFCIAATHALNLAAGAGSKIFETIDRVPSIDIASDTGDKPENVVGYIQLKNINFVYPTRPDVKTLNDVSFDVEPGSTVALVGSSGSGKSTIMSLILRFYDPISGGVFLDGRDIKSLNLTWLRRQISLVNQEPVLFKATIAENVSYGLVSSIYENLSDNEKREMIENACKMANAHDFIMNFPDKYETMVGERGALLSGGQKQRIAIARAIIKDPKILLLDEATSALDTQSFYSKLVEIQQIQSLESLEAEENLNRLNSFITPLKDDVTESFTIKDEDHKYLLSSHLNQKSDIEMGLEHHFTAWELIKKVASINKPEFSTLSIGCIYTVSAVILANIVQTFSETGNTLRHDATFWSLMFLGLAVINFFAYFIQNVALGFSSEKLTERIRSMSFSSILRQDISFFDDENHGVGVLTSHLSLDITHINGLAGFRLGNILQVLALIFVSVIVAFIAGWKFTLVCLCCAPLMIGAGLLHIKMISGFHQKSKKAYEYSAQVVCEGVDNIRTVAAFTREDDLWRIYHNLLDEPMRQGIKNALLGSITFAFSNSMYLLVDALTFWYGSKLFMDDEYDLLKTFTVHNTIIMGSSFAGRLLAYAPDMAKAKSASATIISLLERVPITDTWCQSGEKFKTVQGHLKFSDVHFHYPIRSSVPVLRGLNLDVKPGQYAALVGPSGCGKSTIISLIERFYEVTSGEITIDGLNIAKMNVNNLREHIALVSQEPSLYDMTIKDNLFLGCRPGQNITQNDIEKACQEANIHEFIVRLPKGYDTYVGKRGIQLSGGQKQRIAIARALIRDPKILLLDEATSALDSESEKVVQEALDVAARGRTTLAIAHRLSTIQHADVIFVIKDGKVHEQGTHKELLKLQGIYYMMVQEQHLGELN
ncbi:1357_t:CDS:2 [Racocetra fulgida]|uniref:1357_t:CDS:1 n=1 Tax=Racocetra fulgida TaxID=60492 RepID=A0A9N9BHU5_9GLOM|nr:1357_t:CDS:2 [Racocetra fulgida]